MNEKLLNKFRKLLLVPERFEYLTGYFDQPGIIASEKPRFVAMYWDIEAGNSHYFDGKDAGDLDWEFWEMYLTHPVVTPFLTGLQLGGINQNTPDHWLLFDRTSRGLYAVPFSDSIEQLLLELNS